jgi:hypothetical protein
LVLASSPGRRLAKFTINIAVFAVAVALLMRYERRRLVERIAAHRNDALAGVDPAVLDSLPTARSRRRLRKAAGRQGGGVARTAVAYQQRDALDRLHAAE